MDDISSPASDSSRRSDRGLLLAVDRSETMAGGPAAAVAGAIPRLIDRLGPDEWLGLLAFNGKVILPVPVAPVRDGSFINSVLGQITARGSADLSAVLERGIRECRSGPGPADLVLITAGRPTLGLTRRDQLERIAAAGPPEVRVSTIAVGEQADQPLLGAIADAGGGVTTAANDAAELEKALLELVGVGAP